MVKPIDDDAEIKNVHRFSEIVSDAIREASGAVHPASIVGVLNYHSQNVMLRAGSAFHKPTAPLLFMPEKPL